MRTQGHGTTHSTPFFFEVLLFRVLEKGRVFYFDLCTDILTTTRAHTKIRRRRDKEEEEEEDKEEDSD